MYLNSDCVALRGEWSGRSYIVTTRCYNNAVRKWSSEVVAHANAGERANERTSGRAEMRRSLGGPGPKTTLSVQ